MKELPSLTVVLIVIAYFRASCCQKFDFHLVTDTKIWISALADTWTSGSQIACAVSCVLMSHPCDSFVYELKSKACTQGAWTVVSRRALSNPSLQLYSRVSCSSDQGYAFVSNENVSLCYWLSPPTDVLNYTQANRSCAEKGLQMLTLKTTKKLRLFLEIAAVRIGYSVWIGLDDIKVEGDMRWIDDGSILSSDVKAVLFCSGQPNDLGQGEDCVEFNPKRYPCNDDSCSARRRYMCQLGLE